MTKNQIEYAKLWETRRANQRAELLKEREQELTRAIEAHKLQETRRSNLAREGLTAAATAETIRSNQAREGYNLLNLGEITRHNQSVEGYNAQQLAETVRANKAREGLQVQQLNLDTSRLEETRRHNVTSEQMQDYYNRASINEAVRSHKATEALGYAQNQLGYAQLSALNTYRDRELVLRADKQSEEARHNLAAESESHRHNIYSERAQTRANTLRSQEIEVRRQEADTHATRAQFQNAESVFGMVREGTQVAKQIIPIIVGGLGT